MNSQSLYPLQMVLREVLVLNHLSPSNIANLSPTADATTFDTEQTNIDNWVDSWAEEFVTGAKSITNHWSSYLSGLKAFDLSSYMKTLQHAGRPINTNVPLYHQNQANLGGQGPAKGPRSALWLE